MELKLKMEMIPLPGMRESEFYLILNFFLKLSLPLNCSSFLLIIVNKPKQMVILNNIPFFFLFVCLFVFVFVLLLLTKMFFFLVKQTNKQAQPKFTY